MLSLLSLKKPAAINQIVLPWIPGLVLSGFCSLLLYLPRWLYWSLSESCHEADQRVHAAGSTPFQRARLQPERVHSKVTGLRFRLCATQQDVIHLEHFLSANCLAGLRISQLRSFSPGHCKTQSKGVRAIARLNPRALRTPGGVGNMASTWASTSLCHAFHCRRLRRRCC